MARAPKEPVAAEENPAFPSPRKASLLFGHEEAEQMLRDCLDRGRLPHAWLICGPRGIGKATLAWRFARYVLARTENWTPHQDASGSLFGDLPEPTEDPDSQDGKGPLYIDPERPVAHRIAAGGHADLLSIERGFNEKTGKRRAEIGVDECRAISGFSRMTAAEGGWRVIIIDAVDEMNRNAANALLKSLEEPPRDTLLLLVCHAPGRLLDTIRSRCRRLNLAPLSDQRTDAILSAGLPEMPVEERAMLVGLGGGSPGAALSLMEAGGLELQAALAHLLASLPELDITALYGLADRLNAAGAEQDFGITKDLLLQWIDRAIRAAALGQGGEMAAEQQLMHRLVLPDRIPDWLECRDRLRELFIRCERLNLERRQSLVEAFLRIKATLQDRPQPA